MFSKIIEKSVEFERMKPVLTTERILELTGIQPRVSDGSINLKVGKVPLIIPISDEKVRIKDIFRTAVATGELTKTKGSGNEFRKFLSDCLK